MNGGGESEICSHIEPHSLKEKGTSPTFLVLDWLCRGQNRSFRLIQAPTSFTFKQSMALQRMGEAAKTNALNRKLVIQQTAVR
ncbi:hypothetical protein AAC387_Pa10g1283 [Persea americana]